MLVECRECTYYVGTLINLTDSLFGVSLYLVLVLAF